MREALARAYPPGHSWLRRVIDPVIDPWTYVRAAHLLLLFPLGTAYFVFLVTTLAIGISLSWTLIGPPILLVTLYLTRWVGDAEAWAVRHLHRMELRRPPTTIERGSYRSQVWARIIDPTTWTGVVYMAVQFPVGIATFVFLVVTLTVGGVFLVSPIVVGPDSVIDFDGRWVIDEPAEAWWLPFVGASVLLLTLHLVNVGSAVHAWWARTMLGSRAPHIIPGAPLDDLPPAPEGDPGGGGPVGGGSPAPTPEAPRAPAPEPPQVPMRPSVGQSTPIPPRAGVVDAAGASLLAALTPREADVLRLMARGYSNAEIAEAFVVSEGTVKTHVKRVLSKLEVRDRTQATVWAFDHGFVRPAATTVEGTSREPVPLRARI